MKKSPKISVVTICYNAEKHLEKTILSVIEQDYDNLEYIVIDGGSEDNTVEIIKQYAGSIDQWISEPDKGISDAFNKGIQRASGDLIGLLNADDTYLPLALKTLAEQYDGSDIVYGKMRTILNEESRGDYVPDHLKLEVDMSLCHPSTFIRKDLYEKHGDYQENYKLAMDYELLLRMFTKRASFQYIDKVITAMTMDGVSNVHWKEAFIEVTQAQDQHLGKSGKRQLQNRFKIARKTLAATMNKTGLSFMVEAYRRQFSQIKKEHHG